jgi:hypothetical protein
MEAELDALRVRRMSEVEKEALAKKEELEAQLKEKMEKTMRELEQVEFRALGPPNSGSRDYAVTSCQYYALDLSNSGSRDYARKSPALIGWA